MQLVLHNLTDSNAFQVLLMYYAMVNHLFSCMFVSFCTKFVYIQLPVTRAKSPNLTRRKSCGDAVKSITEDKVSSGRASRHSVGVYREGKASPLLKKASPITPKSKDQTNAWKLNGSNKAKIPTKQSKVKSENSRAKEQGNADIAVQS